MFLKQRLLGAALAVGIALAAFGVNTLWGFRNDYLKIRAEHEAMYGYLARVVAVDPQTSKPITRKDLIEAVLVEKFTKK